MFHCYRYLITYKSCGLLDIFFESIFFMKPHNYRSVFSGKGKVYEVNIFE